MNLGEKLKNRRMELGLTLEQVGEIAKVSKSTVMKWETGFIENMRRNKIILLAEALQVSPLWIIGLEDESYTNSLYIPIYGSIPAGVPLEAIEDILGYEDIPVEWTKGNKEYIALKVKGDSMYPKYLDKDVVIIKLQPDCESGQDCACYVNGFDTTLKTIIKYDDRIELKPLNPNYPPQTFKNNEVTIIGIVKELRRKVI